MPLPPSLPPSIPEFGPAPDLVDFEICVDLLAVEVNRRGEPSQIAVPSLNRAARKTTS